MNKVTCLKKRVYPSAFLVARPPRWPHGDPARDLLKSPGSFAKICLTKNGLGYLVWLGILPKKTPKIHGKSTENPKIFPERPRVPCKSPSTDHRPLQRKKTSAVVLAPPLMDGKQTMRSIWFMISKSPQLKSCCEMGYYHPTFGVLHNPSKSCSAKPAEPFSKELVPSQVCPSSHASHSGTDRCSEDHCYKGRSQL